MKKILIVDDNSDNNYMLEILLKSHGLEVTSALNGKEALEKAHLNPPDLIISDAMMPVMDGYVLCKKWKEDKQLKHIPFIFYTATFNEHKDEEFASRLGAERFIIKPQEPEILMNIIKEVWEERDTARQAMVKPLGEEMEFFRQHNEILFKKLEKKILDLEIVNQKLISTEEKYRLSFEYATDIICMIDSNLNVLSVSPSVERILGYKPQDLIGRSASDLGNILTPESFERAVTEISLVLKGETIPATIYRFIARNGTIKYGEVGGSPVIREGKIIGMISVIRDVSKRKHAEEQLRESEKKYRELYDFLPIPIYEMDLEANITSANHAIYEIFGGTEDNLKNGFKAWQLLSPEDVDRSRKNIERLLNGEQIEGTEYTLMRLDRSVFPAIVISSVICSAGKPAGLRGAIVDITERKQAEAALKESEEKYRLVVDNATETIFIAQEGMLKFVNPATVKLLGYPEELLTSKPFIEFIYLDDRELVIERHIKRMSDEKVPSVYPFRVVTVDGTIKWVEIYSVMINWEGKPASLNFLNDITSRKQVEDERQKNFELLRQTLGATIQAMAMTVEVRDPYTAGHQRRVADLARSIAAEMGLTNNQIDGIRTAAVIHDIGKISIPAEILSKPSRLSNVEFSLIKVHPQAGYEILKNIEFPWPVARMILEHHERINGSGYPNGLKGEDILIESRIIAVADVVEAIASHRPYRPALGINIALDEIVKNKGTQFDPDVVDACLRLFNQKDYKIIA